MERRPGDIHQDIRDFISLQKDIRSDDVETACRRDLRVVDPQHDMEKIEKGKDELLDDAYKWILDTPEYTAFTDWNNNGPEVSKCRLLWIKGHAGTGKTMLMIGIIRELSHQPVALAPKLSFFFCQGREEDSNNVTSVLRSLIWLLLIQQPELTSHLRPKYEESGPNLFKDNAFFALSEVFQNMLKDTRLLPVYFAVDALDECEHGLPDLIKLISISLTLSDKVRWLVSSRPSIMIEGLETTGMLLELDAQSLERPVRVYINHKLLALNERNGYDEDTLAKISSIIHERAGNTFLWAALVFKQLDYEDTAGRHALEILNQLPSGLSKLYDHMMKRIEQGPMQDQAVYKNVLAATCLAYRRLSLSELAIVAGLPPEMGSSNTVEKCGSFLSITDGSVHLTHQSAKDYLIENFESSLQSGGVAQGHVDIGIRCIDAMSSVLCRNMYSLWFGPKLKDMSPPGPDPLAQIRYACIFWADHLSAPDAKCSELRQEFVDDGRVHGFLREHFLHWLESMSLHGKLWDGIQSIRRLLHVVQLQTTASERLLEFLQDAEKFMLMHGSVIERAPLQTYGSALVLSPTMSIVRNAFWKERLPFIDLATGVGGYWSAHRQTLDGHSKPLNHVVYSPDGKTIASASDDNTVRLWDAALGAHRQTLEGHIDRVRHVVFSPDGETIASASEDYTVRVWDATTGAHRWTLKGHSDKTSNIAFSPDGKTIASASEDNTVRLWDATTGTHRRTLEGHNDWVRHVAFSPDGKMIASASDDTTLRLWDAVMGAHRRTLEGHGNFVILVAFSPDSKTLASASEDKTVRLWDAATGAHRKTLEGHSSWLMHVAFSPEGKTIASAADDKTIRIWDAATGAHQLTLKGHGSSVVHVAFSPDCKTIASASYDGMVRLWDAATGVHRRTLEGHSRAVSHVAFSPDGKTIASASYDNTVRLWDAVTVADRRTLEGHNDSVTQVAFSPDSKAIASASYDNTIQLWDATTGSHRLTLKGHSRWVSHVAFSPDGSMMASASYDYTVRVWDATTGAHRRTLEGHSGKLSHVAFSPDSKTIASASYDNTGRLWDAMTGVHSLALEGHSSTVVHVAFSPDGKTIASASFDTTIRLWDATTGSHRHTLDGHRDWVTYVAFSPDGKTIASASYDETVRLWDATTGAHRLSLERHSNWVSHVSFSTDGMMIASVSYPKTVWVWDATTGEHRRTLEGLSDSAWYTLGLWGNGETLEDEVLYGLSFSSDNEWILWNSEHRLWLPREFQPVCSAIAPEGSTFILGCETGRVLIFRFLNSVAVER